MPFKDPANAPVAGDDRWFFALQVQWNTETGHTVPIRRSHSSCGTSVAKPVGYLNGVEEMGAAGIDLEIDLLHRQRWRAIRLGSSAGEQTESNEYGDT